MRQIQVMTAKPYTVSVGHGILSNLGITVRKLTQAERVCIVSDENVWPIYGQTVVSALHSTGLSSCQFIFSAGESSKNSTVFLELLNYLAENQITRSDCIIALGGGVTGDLAGFAAATYLRGIAYVQAPTTLLAMVDSSVGGKTGIDLPAGKNLCGAFYQPVAVLCDLDTLDSLPQETFCDGCAEVIKYGILFDQNLFAYLEQSGMTFDREAVIARCIELKRDVVAQDEFDNADRMLLNLGHTIGHAIESCSDYRISHGKAVAIGTAIVCRSSKCRDTGRITSLLERFHLPTETEFTAQALLKGILWDKKRAGCMIHLIIPTCIGHCAIVPTPVDSLPPLIEEGL